jgi:uncharacterized protein YciI
MARSPTARKKPPAADAPPTPAPARAGKLFAVTRSRGPAWNPALPVEHQAEWSEHADFMNALAAEGFVIMGGPLDDTPYTMLAVRAESAAEVRVRLTGDPWETSRVLETTRIAGWTLALGADRI